MGLPCHAVQCNAMQCNAVPYNAIQCNAMPTGDGVSLFVDVQEKNRNEKEKKTKKTTKPTRRYITVKMKKEQRC